jgi:hypothetical protein
VPLARVGQHVGGGLAQAGGGAGDDHRLARVERVGQAGERVGLPVAASAGEASALRRPRRAHARPPRAHAAAARVLHVRPPRGAHRGCEVAALEGRLAGLARARRGRGHGVTLQPATGAERQTRRWRAGTPPTAPSRCWFRPAWPRTAVARNETGAKARCCSSRCSTAPPCPRPGTRGCSPPWPARLQSERVSYACRASEVGCSDAPVNTGCSLGETTTPVGGGEMRYSAAKTRSRRTHQASQSSKCRSFLGCPRARSPSHLR